MQRIVCLFIILLIIIIYSEVLIENFEIIKKKANDNKTYYVQNYDNNDDAANVLSFLANQSVKLVDSVWGKYPDENNVKRLKEKFNVEQIREAEHEKDSTSYTINKGEMMHLCLREKNRGKTLHDQNLLMFVIIHELAHIASESVGHNAEFYDNFKFLLKEAVELGVYHPVNFHTNPVKYCGIDVTNNPYYDKS
jgi:hypothetical protein